MLYKVFQSLVKYQYPAVNVDSRSAELHNVNEWALANNLKLYLTKSQEIIFLQTKDEKQNSQFPIKSHYTSTGANCQNSWRRIYQ